MTEALNPVLFNLATARVWKEAGSQEKTAFQPPSGTGDPMAGAAGGGGGAPAPAPPPMDPMAGGAPPMDPMMGGAPPMDPMAAGGGMPPGQPGMPGAQPGAVDPATGAPMAPKMKPEQMMQMIDFRMYNMQMQITALLTHIGVEIPAGALVTPPGQMTPPPEAAMPGGTQDPTQQQGADQQGGAGSEISAIEPMGGASPEMAQAKMGSADPIRDEFLKDAQAHAPAGYKVVLVKQSVTKDQGDVNSTGPSSSSPDKSLSSATHPGRRPATQSISAGGSKDPKSRTEAGDDLGPVNKSAGVDVIAFAQQLAEEMEVPKAASYVGDPVDRAIAGASPVEGAAAVAAMYRSNVNHRVPA